MKAQEHLDPYAGTMHLWSMPGLAHMTMKKKQLAAFLESTGGQIMARGHLYDIVSKHLGAGIYRVSTKLWESS